MPRLVPELACSDIEKSLDFYTHVLGFAVQYGRPDEGFVYLEREGAELMLDQIGKTRTWVKGALEAPFGRGMNLQIQVKDVQNLYQKTLDEKAEIFMDIEEKWYDCGGVMKGNQQFIVCDPDGYLLRFFKDLGEKQANE